MSHAIFLFVRWAGRFHPMAVHFPIALLWAAAMAEIGYAKTKHESFRKTAHYSLALAFWGSLIAVALGLADAKFVRILPDMRETLMQHRLICLGASILAALALLAIQRSSILYRILLFASVVLVSMGGHLGALLVYGKNYFSWP